MTFLVLLVFTVKLIATFLYSNGTIPWTPYSYIYYAFVGVVFVAGLILKALYGGTNKSIGMQFRGETNLGKMKELCKDIISELEKSRHETIKQIRIMKQILEEIEYTKGEDWILRKAEQKWASQNRDNCINRRRCYVSPSVKRKERDQRVKKYHESEKGRLALRKAAINHRLKQTDKPVTGLKRSELQDELEKINTRQAELRKEKISSSSDEEPPVFPPDLHPDQFDETSSNKE